MGGKNSGRRPGPTALKVLRGVVHMARMNQDEPTAPDGPVVRPGTLTRGGRIVWDEMSPIVLAMRTLTAADVSAFATYCEIEATRRLASSQKDATADTAIMPLLTALKLDRDSANLLRPYYERFGLEPSGRARLRVPKAVEPPVSKWAG